MMLSNLVQDTDAQAVINTLRVRATQVLLGFILVASLLLAFTIQAETGLFSFPSMVIIVGVVLAIVGLVMVHRNENVQTIGSIAVLYLIFVSLVGFISDFDILVILLLIATISAAIIPPRSVFWAVNALAISGMGWYIFFGESGVATIAANGATAIVTTLIIATLPPVLGLMLRFFIDRLERVTYQAQRIATLLEASANIGQNVSQTLELDELLNQAVEIVRDRFAFYHVQIFLIDDNGDFAYLRASTGYIGEQMLARGHRLRIDSNSVIGRVSLTGEPIIARDTDQSHAFNELLPDTRSELAIPIKDKDGVIGALDVQSHLTDAFTATEIRVLNVIANQLAIAIRNARLFESQTHNIRENKRLFIEAETSLREIQRLNRQLTRQAWTDYLKMDRRITGVTLEGQSFSNKAGWTPEMVESGRKRRAIKKNSEDGNNTVTVPIELRGEVLGAIEIETPDAEDNESTLDMIQAISQRLAVSLDNARLFEETQEATAQEQRVGELVARYQTANTVDDLLQITLEGLVETLGAEAGSIRLGYLPDEVLTNPDPESNGHQNGDAPA